MEPVMALRLSCMLPLLQMVGGIVQERIVAVSWDARQHSLVAHNDSSAKDIIAVCVFSDSRLYFGWASVYVKTDGRYVDSQQAYAAGYAEGRATSLMIEQHYANMYAHYCDTDPAFCTRLLSFYRANLQSLLQNAIQYGDRDPFWHQTELALLQLSGLQRGLTRAESIRYDPYELPADFERLVLLNLYKDVGDLEWALGMLPPKAPRDPGVAFFKTTSGNAEAIAAHATWGHYSGMNKLLKKYAFNYKLLAGSGQPVPATVITFSGYPGGVSSGDDFILTSTNLAVLGTGIRNQNPDLWSRLTPNNTVPAAFRSLAASRLAKSAKEWIHTYSRGNAGTGNSQWTVIDYNLFKRKMKQLPQNFVWYHEELPGYSVSADVTSVVENQGYWAMYNIPFFPGIYNSSGMARLAAQHGDWFTYDRCPRALMFKRGFKQPGDIEKVLDFIRVKSKEKCMLSRREKIKKNMNLLTFWLQIWEPKCLIIANEAPLCGCQRYNNYQNDPLAVCAACEPKHNAENALSARSDLNPSVGRYPFFEMGKRPHGGTDAKVVNSTMIGQHSLWTQCGPTSIDKQSFSWSSSPFASVPHAGQPDEWNFPPALKEWAG